MKNILIINGKKSFAHSKGDFNQTMVDTAKNHLENLTYKVSITNVDDSYDIEQEIEKWLEASVIIYQMPAWWMGVPWTVKKYIDEVITAGHGKLYANDGRTRKDPTKKYGSGGLLNNTKYMLSVTWNAPEKAFTDKDDFFNGVGIDNVYLPIHKAHEFLAMTALETFSCHDVIKQPTIENDIERYKNHLDKVFKS